MKKLSSLAFAIILLSVAGGVLASAATKAPTKKVTAKVAAVPFLKAGWIPYWSKTAGGTETTQNLSKLNIISPFSYEVSAQGTLIDKLKVTTAPWPDLFATAKQNGIKIYPTVAWFDRAQIYTILSDSKLRKAHIQSISDNILSNANFDGVDIDYENKSAETNKYFTLFLKELSTATKSKNKKLVCTIEARTPVSSRYKVVTKEILANIEYANDYKSINTYCDQVRLMTYDQQGADVKLSAVFATSSTPYMPIADPKWVEKVIQETTKTIAPSKIMLGLATFGYKYELTPDPKGGYFYTKLRAINYADAYAEAKNRGVQIDRNSAGELSFVYSATGVQSFSGATGTPLHLIWFPDAESMLDKIALAKKYKLGGIVVFKFDGGADQSMWDVLNMK